MRWAGYGLAHPYFSPPPRRGFPSFSLTKFFIKTGNPIHSSSHSAIRVLCPAQRVRPLSRQAVFLFEDSPLPLPEVLLPVPRLCRRPAPRPLSMSDTLICDPARPNPTQGPSSSFPSPLFSEVPVSSSPAVYGLHAPLSVLPLITLAGPKSDLPNLPSWLFCVF